MSHLRCLALPTQSIVQIIAILVDPVLQMTFKLDATKLFRNNDIFKYYSIISYICVGLKMLQYP